VLSIVIVRTRKKNRRVGKKKDHYPPAPELAISVPHGLGFMAEFKVHIYRALLHACTVDNYLDHDVSCTYVLCSYTGGKKVIGPGL
jgi:hypothetical protein